MHLPGPSAPLLLELDLDVALADPPPHAPVAKLLGRGHPALRDDLGRLHRAAKDPRVAGLVVRTGGAQQPLAHAQELRGALLEFGATGRPTVAWAETDGEFGHRGRHRCEPEPGPTGRARAGGSLTALRCRRP